MKETESLYRMLMWTGQMLDWAGAYIEDKWAAIGRNLRSEVIQWIQPGYLDQELKLSWWAWCTSFEKRRTGPRTAMEMSGARSSGYPVTWLAGYTGWTCDWRSFWLQRYRIRSISSRSDEAPGGDGLARVNVQLWDDLREAETVRRVWTDTDNTAQLVDGDDQNIHSVNANRTESTFLPELVQSPSIERKYVASLVVEIDNLNEVVRSTDLWYRWWISGMYNGE